MNLFILDSDYKQAAEYYQDLHVKKICVEAAQILQTAYTLDQLKLAPPNQQGNPRGHSYKNHPVCVWARQNINNFTWALFHADAIHNEFIYRFDKPHFSKTFVDWCFDNLPSLPDNPMTEHPQCFGAFANLRHDNPVIGYRSYYKAAKSEFIIRGKIVSASWTRRNKPDWF